jgi:MFS family permease
LWGPLQHREYRVFWLASLGGNLGNLMQGVAVAWIITGMTSAPWLVALVPVAGSLPALLVSIPAGIWGDRHGRARVLRAASLWIAAVAFVLAICVLVGGIAPWSLLLLLFLIGAGHSARVPSWNASIQDLVPAEKIAPAISLNSMSFNAARTVGPALGGLLVGLIGAGWVLLVNAILALGVFFAVGTWRPKQVSPDSTMGWSEALRVGVGLLVGSSPLRRILYRLGLINFAAAGLWAFLPLIGRDRLGLMSWQYGMLLSAMGIGAIAGAILAPRLRNWLGPRRMVSLAAMVLGGAILLLAWVQTYEAALLAVFICGSAIVNCNINLNVSFQTRAPAEARGRLLSFYFLTFELALAVGALLLGLLASVVSIQVALSLSALLLLGSPWIVPRRPMTASEPQPSGEIKADR